jgi:hypothetical protein
MYPCPRVPSCAGVRNTPPLRTADAWGSVLEGDAVKSKKQVVMVELVSGVAQDVDKAFATPVLHSHKADPIIINARVVMDDLLGSKAGMGAFQYCKACARLIRHI